MLEIINCSLKLDTSTLISLEVVVFVVVEDTRGRGVECFDNGNDNVWKLVSGISGSETKTSFWLVVVAETDLGKLLVDVDVDRSEEDLAKISPIFLFYWTELSLS